MDTKQDIREYLATAQRALVRGDLLYTGYYIGKAARHWSANSEGIDTEFIFALHESLPAISRGTTQGLDDAMVSLDKALGFVQE